MIRIHKKISFQLQTEEASRDFLRDWPQFRYETTEPQSSKHSFYSFCVPDHLMQFPLPDRIQKSNSQHKGPLFQVLGKGTFSH